MAGITTTDAVYRALLTELQLDVDGAGDAEVILEDAFIYVSAEPIFTAEDAQYLQLIPGVPTSVDPTSGSGLIHEQFQIAIWSRLLLDQGRQATERITNASLGVFITMTKVRLRMQHFLPSALTEPVRFIQGSQAAESEEHPGWVMMADTWLMGYEIATRPLPP